MIHLVLSPRSRYLARARQLGRAGAWSVRLMEGNERTLPFPTVAGDRVILGSSVGLFQLRPFLFRCLRAELGSVELLVEGPLPAVSRIGWRWRPWLQALWLPAGQPPPEEPAPAPWRFFSHLGDLRGAGAADPSPRREAAPWGESASPFPPTVQLQTTSRCEAGCPHCPHPGPANPGQFMGEPLFQRILDECAVHRPRWIELYLQGEPLLDPRLPAWSRQVRRVCSDALVSVVTQERALTAERARALAAGGLHVLFVSVNLAGPVPEERVAERLEAVCHRTRPLREAGTALVVTTLGELLERGVRGALRRQCRKRGLPLEIFRITSRLGAVEPDALPVAGNPVSGPCTRPFTRAYVLADGRVVACCEDWRQRWVVGDLNRRSLAEIWQGAPLRRFRRGLLTGRPYPPCRSCTVGAG